MNEAAGAVLICAVEATALTASELEFYQRVRPAGVTLFAWNVPADPAQLPALVRELQATRPVGAPPLVIAVDQEGGRVARLKPPFFPNAGAAMALAGGRTDAAALREIQAVAEDMGRRLLAIGVNVDFAPVLDVLTEPANHGIGDRAFGTEPAAVSLRAGAFLAGLTASGVKACLKHFPGQGAATVDTHAGGAVVDVSAEVLRSRELAPFRAHLGSVELVMVSHCIYPALAPVEAGRSEAILTGLLRGELAYDGVIVSDDMNMGAMPQEVADWQAALIEAVAAGVDTLLVCRHLERCWRAYDALAAEAERSPAFARRLDAAAARVMRFRRTLA